jgi:hypothetical protein
MRSRIFDTDLVLNPYAGILKSVLYTGSFYFNYRSQMDAYAQEKEEGKWAIEAKTMQGLNSFYKKLLKYSWELMRRYDLPDEWRLNEKQLSDYTDILKEPDICEQYFMNKLRQFHLLLKLILIYKIKFIFLNFNYCLSILNGVLLQWLICCLICHFTYHIVILLYDPTSFHTN